HASMAGVGRGQLGGCTGCLRRGGTGRGQGDRSACEEQVTLAHVELRGCGPRVNTREGGDQPVEAENGPEVAHRCTTLLRRRAAAYDLRPRAFLSPNYTRRVGALGGRWLPRTRTARPGRTTTRPAPPAPGKRGGKGWEAGFRAPLG